ncbi:hypothetical protein LTR56_011197 [Elasticomyces elasticus]|nr:hypothetical protein LTR56_011197 [Elasticomyces elasticus]KAK3650437.1 hypothetical protein LTR22_012528 [Elasticomyces elasticus]KAK4921829.1 hypothetical protein LTR49_010767 [Elasticomyces elasticus]KAK5753437.1 hypothetical protein LTS12_016488 [Elasticomyces elasticus]
MAERNMTVHTPHQVIEGSATTIGYSEVSEVVVFKHHHSEAHTGDVADDLPDNVVIKIYHPANDCIDDEKPALEALAPLEGQEIPTVYGEVAVEERRALALEHIHGVTLAKRMSDFLRKRMLGVLDEDEKHWLCSLDAEIRDLLNKPSQYGHVVHGDGELRNIMVEERDGKSRLRLMDFSHAQVW